MLVSGHREKTGRGYVWLTCSPCCRRWRVNASGSVIFRAGRRYILLRDVGRDRRAPCVKSRSCHPKLRSNWIFSYRMSAAERRYRCTGNAARFGNRSGGAPAITFIPSSRGGPYSIVILGWRSRAQSVMPCPPSRRPGLCTSRRGSAIESARH